MNQGRPKKPVYKFDAEKKLVGEPFPSLKEAAEDAGCSYNVLYSAMKDRRLHNNHYYSQSNVFVGRQDYF